MNTRTTDPSTPSFEIRPLSTQRDFADCLELQRTTWGDDFRELVPAALLQVTQKVGGIAAGAFDAGRLIGFVYGISGMADGVPAHWSHMLAVCEDRRGHGVGRALKLYQRRCVRQLGIERMYWTYDPLVSRNAHLNLNRLGVSVVEYIRNMYGETSMSVTDAAIGTDRFVVCWDLAAPDQEVAAPAPSLGDAPLVTAPPIVGSAQAAAPPLVGESPVRVEIPWDIQAVRAADPDAAAAWRSVTRRAFEHYLSRDYGVRALLRDRRSNRVFYVLERV